VHEEGFSKIFPPPCTCLHRARWRILKDLPSTVHLPPLCTMKDCLGFSKIFPPLRIWASSNKGFKVAVQTRNSLFKLKRTIQTPSSNSWFKLTPLSWNSRRSKLTT